MKVLGGGLFDVERIESLGERMESRELRGNWMYIRLGRGGVS